MNFIVRKDFESIEGLLSRLYVWSHVFQDFAIKDWSHWVNNEDYSKVYKLENNQKKTCF